MDLFLRNGIFAVPVALVATNECTIRMNNLKVILAQLRAATTHFQSISEVRQFGNGGIFCLSSQQLCVQDLLKVPCLPPTRNGCRGGCMDDHTNRRRNRRTHGRADGCMKGTQTDAWTDGSKNEWTDECFAPLSNSHSKDMLPIFFEELQFSRLTESGDQPFLQLIMRVFNVERGWMRYKPSMGFAAPRTISRTIYDI
ncbi:uncharacterized protein LOC142803999 isoform X1 [Rhipicephalus microplus]|uniref:uncharacterized protein LOC142803999 isoform X1 n=1 Tax=Rhipicephalus microplus TaxID=6941 RepID=UPI003F6C845A